MEGFGFGSGNDGVYRLANDNGGEFLVELGGFWSGGSAKQNWEWV